jgi:UDP-glucose 6-dehydrogenase
MSRIAVVGTGYVGLTTGACFAHLGHDVVCADIDVDKVARLSRGDVPILEAGLDEIVAECLERGRLSFVVGAATAASSCEFAYLCVPTPQGSDGSADLSYIEAAAREIAPVLPSGAVVVNKSTVPVGSTRVVERVLGRDDIYVVSNPEFLREGSAVHDFLHPDRIVIGSEHSDAAIRVAGLFTGIQAPLIVTDPASAETIKYASNAFLATKVSFVNAIANVCEAVGADVREVVLGMGYDKRIGFEFLKPGPGWGGSCFHPDETVLVRRSGRISVLTFAELFERVEVDGADGWDALSWDPGDPRPEFLPIATFSKRPYDGDMITIRTKMGRRVTVTADHPVVACDGVDADGARIVQAGSLSTADWVPLAQGFPLLDDLPLVMRTPAARQAMPHENPLPAEILATPRFWRVIGLYLAEGHFARKRVGGATIWSFHPTREDDLVEEVASLWRELGVRVQVVDRPTARAVVVHSARLGRWFDELGLGRNSYDKAVPDAIWGRPEAEKWALLRGLWDGDGSWSLVNGGPSAIFEYGTVSKQLADGMLRLLGDIGVVASVRVGRTAKSTVDTYWLRVSGTDQLDACWFLFPDEEYDVVLASIERQARRILPTGYRRLSKNAAWVRVVEVERTRYVGDVYSVHVPGPETVVTTSGVVLHNCFPKDSRALVHIADNAGYGFDLLQGVIAVNDEQFDRVAQKIERLAGGSVDGVTIAVWGLTFKARTDDLRDSPSPEVIKRLRAKGARIQAFDPAVSKLIQGIDVRADAYAACEGAAVLAVLTEWDDFRWVDFDKVKSALAQPHIVDARNLLDPAAVRRKGFTYEGIGR